MDSPLTHCEPSSISEIEVVTGPYALTWGAGNMSAIRAETHGSAEPTLKKLQGRFETGYDSNIGAAEATGSIFGNVGRLSYRVSGSWRTGGDYTSGDGAVVPADFTSSGGTGKFGLMLSECSRLSVSSGYQEQHDIDYPGRMMDAEFFKTLHVKGGWHYDQGPADEGRLRSFEAVAYLNDVTHRMNNDNKPTAKPDVDRTPPFAIDAESNMTSAVWGGRAAALFDFGKTLEIETGADIYASNRDGRRLIKRRDSGVVTSDDIVWPNAWIIDTGIFTRARRAIGKASTSAAIRLDRVKADPDSLGEFYVQNVVGGYEANETNLSGAASVSIPVAMNWTVSMGIGSVVRTADVNERYSNRFHSTKMQVTAEFMGNPRLKPERSTQLDLWVRTDHERVSGSINGYARRIDNYITVEATDLSPRMPSNPYAVYRYVNGEAEFIGLDGSFEASLSRTLMLGVDGAYTRATDLAHDEPVLGIPPLELGSSLRWTHPGARKHYVSGAMNWADRQDRVAETKGEKPTDGHTTFDLKVGWIAATGVELRGGVLNVTDANTVNHLNTRNPFTKEQVPEPGRVFFVELSYSL